MMTRQLQNRRSIVKPIVTLYSNKMETLLLCNHLKLLVSTTTRLYQFLRRNNTFVKYFNGFNCSKKSLVDSTILKKIKLLQLNYLKNWKGLQVEYISRPGKNTHKSNYNIVNLIFTHLYRLIKFVL
jgi:hypothetical protein